MKLDVKVHTTRLKQRLLTHFTDMHAQKEGRVVLITFEEDIGTPLSKACELYSADDIIHLHVLQRLYVIICLGKLNPLLGCQKESVLPLLLALVNMILEGPSIKDQIEDTVPAALYIY